MTVCILDATNVDISENAKKERKQRNNNTSYKANIKTFDFVSYAEKEGEPLVKAAPLYNYALPLNQGHSPRGPLTLGLGKAGHQSVISPVTASTKITFSMSPITH